MSDKDTFDLNIINETITNGRVNNKRTAMNPMAINSITYVNSKNGKVQTQKYLEMQDIVVPVIIKKDKKTGELYFAMQYEYNPSSKYGVQLDLPDFPFFDEKKDDYSNGDITECLEENLSYLGLEMIGFKYLDSGVTAINQSITDQIMKVVYVYVKDNDEIDNNLEWYPASCLQDYLSFKHDNELSSTYGCVITKYALKLFYEKFKNEINKKEQVKFTYRDDIFKGTSPWRQTKIIMEHKYRFGETLTEIQQTTQDITNYGSFVEMGTSKKSVECLIVRRENGKLKIGLSRQQRSPFIARKGIDEFFYEEVGGMLEEGECFEDALKREVPEETGFKIENGKLHKLLNATLIGKGSQESSAFYIYEMDGTEKYVGQELDADESIDDIEWFDLEEIDLNKFHAPILTKYAILLARDFFGRTKDIEKEFDR